MAMFFVLWHYFVLWLFLFNYNVNSQQYNASWDSLDKRPLPPWYDNAKFGIFMHWGVYAGGPSFYIHPAWMWNDWINNQDKDITEFMKKNYPPTFQYPDFVSMFKAEFFNPDEFADILESSGAKYVVLTSKHHEGFTMWPSSHSWNWNAMDVGPHRDLVGELANSIRTKTNLRFGLYYSLYEWFNPLYLNDKTRHYSTDTYVQLKVQPELRDIINQYKPDILWSDGDWEAPDTYWNSTEFLAWLYNESPVKDTVVTNDRWGAGTECHHGGYYTCMDRFNPGYLLKHKWENCMTVDRDTWGYRRTASIADILSIKELIAILAQTVSCNGNLLLNVGPTADGRISPVFEERLREMGQWLKTNGDAIYKTRPWTVCQNDTLTKNVWYTSKNDGTGIIVYAIFWMWPEDGALHLGCMQADIRQTKVTMLGFPGIIKFESSSKGTTVYLDKISFSMLPNLWAWVIKLQYLPKIYLSQFDGTQILD